ncbi:MAG: hypothetical protein JEY71_10455 [Sphaerochaeta sp.]|nr:hypothetical protein [Sphaerochaeta sp.]
MHPYYIFTLFSFPSFTQEKKRKRQGWPRLRAKGKKAGPRALGAAPRRFAPPPPKQSRLRLHAACGRFKVAADTWPTARAAIGIASSTRQAWPNGSELRNL